MANDESKTVTSTRPETGKRKRFLAGAAAVAVALGAGMLSTATPAMASPAPSCTISGTSGPDTLRGTARADVICGLGGDDVIRGNAGNDIIRGNAGDDEILGGPGADRTSGGTGDDSSSGGLGPDSMVGDGGGDFLDGGSGPDQISGDGGNDALMGGNGVDSLIPGAGEDVCAPDSADRVSGPCEVDRTAPTLTWLDVPGTVEAGTTLTATFSLEDPSGITPGSASAAIGGSPGWITTWCGLRMDAELVSGTETDGVWSVSCDVPEDAVSDPYSLWAGAQDNFGNSTVSGGTADWVEFEVVGGSTDNQAPDISDVVIPASVEPGETATITWRAADPSTVSSAIAWIYRPGPPWGVLWGDGIVEMPVLSSGDATDGSYSQTFTLPVDSPVGTYAVYISVRDDLGNRTMEQYGSFTVG